MSKKIKRIASILMLVSTVFALFVLTSCGATSAVEDFLTSDNYTFKAGESTVKVNDADVYRTNGIVEEYLYYDDAAGCYYYCTVIGDVTTKLYIDSEQYMFHHESLVSGVADASKIFTAFLQIADRLEERDDGSYSFNNCVLKVNDEGVITCSIAGGVTTYTVSKIGETEITIPSSIKSMKPSNKQGGEQK